MTEGAGEKSIYHHMARGAAFTLVMRWALRLIGLISTLILARLLAPSDFGIISMAAITHGLIDMFADTGVSMLMIRSKDQSRDFLDTSWTVKLLQGVVVGLVLLAAGPLTAWWFEEPALIPVMAAYALIAVIDGASSIGPILFLRDLEFHKDLLYKVYGRVAIFVVTIAAAFFVASYWSIVFGYFVGALFSVWLSFAMHPYRPRFSLSKFRDFVHFGLSMIPLNIGRFLNMRIDGMVAGRVATTETFGLYSVSIELSNIVSEEIILPVNRAVYPAYAKIVDNAKALKDAFLNVLGTTCLLSLPMSLGLLAVREDFIAVVLGAKWMEAAPLIGWLALFAWSRSMFLMLTGQILIIAGREAMTSLAVWIQVAMLTPAIVYGGFAHGLEGVVKAASFASFATLPVGAIMLMRVIPVSTLDLIGATWRPVAAGALMAFAVEALHVEGLAPLPRLFLDVLAGAVVYALAIVALWGLSGRPASAEGLALAKIGSFLGRLR